MNQAKAILNKRIIQNNSTKIINKIGGEFAFHKLLTFMLFSLIVISLIAFNAVNNITALFVLIFFSFVISYFWYLWRIFYDSSFIYIRYLLNYYH